MPGFFSNTLAVLRREIYRVARQPMYWLLTVILPIVAFAFFAVLLYKGVARDIPIAVVDQDNSTLSRKVTQMIDATPTAWVAYGVQGMEEAERLMLQGKVMGIVLIPDFFEKNILNNSQTHLESYLTGTNITVNGLLAKDLQTTVTTFTAGIQLQLLMKQGLTEKQAMAQLMPVQSIYQTDNLLLAAVPHRRPQRIRLDLHGCRRDSRAGARPADLFHALFAGLRDAGTS